MAKILQFSEIFGFLFGDNSPNKTARLTTSWKNKTKDSRCQAEPVMNAKALTNCMTNRIQDNYGKIINDYPKSESPGQPFLTLSNTEMM